MKDTISLLLEMGICALAGGLLGMITARLRWPSWLNVLVALVVGILLVMFMRRHR